MILARIFNFVKFQMLLINTKIRRNVRLIFRVVIIIRAGGDDALRVEIEARRHLVFLILPFRFFPMYKIYPFQ